MDITASNSISSRTVTASNNSSRDRTTQSASDTKVDESRAKDRANEQRAVQQKQQERNDERRLEGRLVSYGQKNSESANDYQQISYNRSRVDAAYNVAEKDTADVHRQQQSARNNDAIDIIV